MKVAAYLRVSTDEQHEENQLPSVLAYIDSLHLDAPEVVVIREQISAWKNPDRKTLDNLLTFDIVVVAAYDRLYRNMKKFIEMMKYYEVKGVQVHSVRESWLRDLMKAPPPWNEMIYDLCLKLVGYTSESESKKRSERTKAGLARAVADGAVLGRGPAEIDFERVWVEYETQGRSINKTSKVLPYGYGTVYDVIKNDAHTAEDWAKVIEKRKLKKSEKK
jgi:putative DNA-invertase from lambdoid prophage Rac